MKATTAIGIGLAFAMLMVATLMEGSTPMSFINIPALLIVCGGTSGAVLASVTIDQAKRMPALAKVAMSGKPVEPAERIPQMVSLAEKARREGLLALENDVEALDDEFVKKGLQLVVDGADSDIVAGVLRSDIDGTAERHGRNSAAFQTAGGFAPTLGILGTVMSLVHVLENLSNPGSLGHSIAGAFLATLYGVGSANLILLPIANKLKALSAAELNEREMLLEAVLSVQAGENPRMLAERLRTFVPPAERAEGKAKRPEAVLEAEAVAEAA